jgi:hypothetical protein
MKHLAEEQTQLREQWEEASKARNALLKDVGRERRQHDVEKQTWLEKCKNLEAALELRKKKEDGTPIEVPFHFSPHSPSAFGTPLADVKTLGDLGVLDGDVLYMINPDVQPTAPVEAAPPPKKK